MGNENDRGISGERYQIRLPAEESDQKLKAHFERQALAYRRLATERARSEILIELSLPSDLKPRRHSGLFVATLRVAQRNASVIRSHDRAPSENHARRNARLRDILKPPESEHTARNGRRRWERWACS
jgi:hypothetical protein